MRLLPPATSPERVVAISIYLPSELAQENGERPDNASTAPDGASNANIDRLVDLALGSRLPFTWGVSESLYAELQQRFESQTPSQELAILGDENWLGHSKSRGAIVRTLNSAVDAADAAGFVPKSLLLHGVSLDADFDLLAKHGISIVACDETSARKSKPPKLTERPSSVRTLRFGVWELPATVHLPRVTSRFGLTGSSTSRLIDRAVTRGELSHVAIDGPAILANPQELRALERLLTRLARQQQQGKLQVQTLSAVASQLVQSPDRTSATSILRSSPAA